MKLSQTSPISQTDNRLLSRVVKLMLAMVMIISLAFGAYYYWDRYIHLGDRSPEELSLTHLKEIAQKNPDDPAARLSLAQSYIENKDYSAAQQQAQAVLDANPENAGALLLLGISLTEQGRPQAAIDALGKFAALRREAQDPQMDKILEAALFYQGQNYLALRQPDQAITALSEAIQIDPTDADAMYLLGNAHAQRGQNDLAVEAYQNAVRFVPNYLEAYHSMQASYAAMHQPEKVTYARGMEAYSSKDFAQARQYLEQASAKLPEFAPVHLGLALTYEQLGEFQLALASVQRSLQLEPDDFAAQNLLTRLQPSNK